MQRNIQTDILNLEHNLLQQRKVLNDLIYYSNSTNNEIILSKIDILQKDIDATQYQLNILKQSIVNNVYQQPYQQPINKQILNQPSNIQQQKQPIFKKKDLENIFGKSFMGIFASILIFISLIIFATIVMPFLTNEIKLVLMYLVSFGLTTVGFFFLQKDNNNKLYLSLSGCGVGAIYISLFLSNIYFGMLNDILLYLCLFIWSICIYKLKQRNNLFLIIGQIGITIASYMGTIKCFSNEDYGKLLFLCVFFIITQLIYNGACNFKYKDINFEQIPIIIFASNFINESIQISIFNEIETMLLISIIVVSIILFISTLLLIRNIKPNKNNYFSALIFSAINTFLIFGLLLDKVNILLILFMICLHIYIEYKTKILNFDIKVPIISTTMMIIYLFLTTLFSIDLLWIIVLGFIIYGCVKNDKFYKTYGCIMTLIYYYRSDVGIGIIENLPIWIIIFMIIIISIFIDKIIKNKDNILRISIYLTSILILPNIIANSTYDLFSYETRDISQLILYLNIVFFLNLFIRKKLMYNENNEICRLTKNSTNIVNSILMTISLFTISFSDITPLLLIDMIIISIYMFTLNSKNLLEKQNMLYGLWVGFKFLLLMIAILNALNTINFMLSICCFVFACGSVFIGFMKNYKSLRIFGLILSFISTIKLILFDFNYESSIEQAFSFFICGIICFIISLIYNKLNKNLKN